MSSVTVFDCPNATCARKLRVPADRGALEITCPDCRERWTWAPPAAEICELRFRCAKTGGRFSVLFAREIQDEQFRIREIAANQDEALERKWHAMIGGARQAPRDELGFAIDRPQPQSYGADDLDFAGWRCACCGYAPSADGYGFINCNRCNEVVCGARIIAIKGGGTTFRCHDGCGNSGEIEGTIAAFDGTGLTARRAAATKRDAAPVEPARDALPPWKR